MPHARSITLGAATFEVGAGGIARLARLTSRALTDLGKRVDAVSFLEQQPVALPCVSSAGAKGSKLGFVAKLHTRAMTSHSFIYDSVGVGKAHPSLPGLAKPCAIWMCGIEVWEAARPLAVAALRKAQLPIAISQFTLQRFTALHGPLPQAQVCLLGSDEDSAPPQQPPSRGPPTALILSRIDATENYKGHAELIACWPQVRQAVPDARLIIAGGGSGLAQCRALVSASPAASAIDVRGFVPEQQLESVWREADIFAMPSRGEGFGFVYVDAMRRGVPIITSTHDAGCEVNAHGETGFSVDLTKSDDLAKSLIALLSNPSLRANMGARAQARWIETFRYSAFLSRFNATTETFLRRSGV